MLLIVDGNNLAWAGFFALGKSMGMDTEERKTRAALVGLVQSVLGLVSRGGEPPDRPADPESITGLAVAFDDGRPLRRRAVYPSYQTGRESTASFVDNEPAVTAAIEQFTGLAATLPARVLRGVNTEADDLAAALTLQSASAVRIASSDRDFLQLVNERVSIYSPVKRLVVDTANFSDQTAPRTSSGEAIAFPRERYLDFRVASGDASDDLPGIPGAGAITAARLLSQNPLDAYLDDPGVAIRVLGRRNVKLEGAVRTGEARRVVERNRALMDLRAAAELYRDLAPVSKLGAWDESGFARWLAEHRIPRVELSGLIRAFAAMVEA